jgi:DNA-directed RNA polymerase specialized sigma subunit
MAYNKRGNSIRWVEKLLKSTNFLKVELLNQERVLKLNKIEQKDAIEGQYLKANTYADRVQTSSKGSVELFAGEEYDFLNLEHETIEQRIEYLNLMIASLDDALNSLQGKEKQIVEMFYVRKKSIANISTETYLSIPHVSLLKRRALSKLAIALRPFWIDAII